MRTRTGSRLGRFAAVGAGAALVVDSLGDLPASPSRVLADPRGVGPLDVVDLGTLVALTH